MRALVSLLSTLFRTAPGIGEWPLIATDISSGFQDVKKRWFNECVVNVDLGLFADKQVKAKVVNTDLGGAAALAITAYQICCAGTLIGSNGYVSKSSRKDFLRLLFSRVSGAENAELSKYLTRYDALSNDAATQRLRFAVDVARYVANEEPPMAVSLHVASIAEKLFSQSAVVIAKAFGDLPRAHKLTQQIALLNKQLRPSR
jgi:hypothetical protein